MFESMIEKLKTKQQKLVFTEGSDPRILEASSRLKKEKILEPILLGNPEEIQMVSQQYGFLISEIEIIEPKTYPAIESMVVQPILLPTPFARHFNL